MAEKFAVIIPAAGASRRYGGAQKKTFEELDGRAVWLRTVEHFVHRDDVSEVVLVLAAEDIAEFRQRFAANLTFLDLTITAGGTTRAESVQNGLSALTTEAAYVAVHDAARPLLTKDWVTDVFQAAVDRQAVIPAIAVNSTVKRVADDGRIEVTVDRSPLRLAQTPQVFARELLQHAYETVADPAACTDEASLVEASGHSVFVCPGWPMNIKITTLDDMKLAELFLHELPASRGLEDLDAFSDGRF
ncbi:MAG: 2-C-methyl-D-erythritol 4-phosphate cytidylyltransferase [Planctomycetaceae bacterium]|nr:2-C-methyl-D-erythritol 4-phosphate cytidylyltransferase [Planctomycetaceae bacterium]